MGWLRPEMTQELLDKLSATWGPQNLGEEVSNISFTRNLGNPANTLGTTFTDTVVTNR